jgi:hypothetical protein
MTVRRDASKRLGHGESAYLHAAGEFRRGFPKGSRLQKLTIEAGGAESDSGLFSN